VGSKVLNKFPVLGFGFFMEIVTSYITEKRNMIFTTFTLQLVLTKDAKKGNGINEVIRKPGPLELA